MDGDERNCEPGAPDRAKRPRKPHSKVSKAEQEERIRFTMGLLGRAVHKQDIYRLLKAKYDVSQRTCERYLSCAQARVLEQFDLSRDQMRYASLKTYQAITQDDEVEHRDKILAQNSIDRLLGP
jgi:hypothetical protein